MDIHGKAVCRGSDEPLNLLWHWEHKAFMSLIDQSGCTQFPHILLSLAKIGGGLAVCVCPPKVHKSRVVEAYCFKRCAGLAS